MTRLPIRYGFCIAVAVLAAGIADPIVEFASNAGCFGSGNFTDHSNLDVVPALLAGIALVALHVARRARAVLAGEAFPRGITPLWPAIFIFQIVALYGMETLEQFATHGRPLGPLIWLGAPPAISLGIHALVCLAVTLWLGRTMRTLAATALHVIRLIRAIAVLTPAGAMPPIRRSFYHVCFNDIAPVFCRIGERAPPLTATTI